MKALPILLLIVLVAGCRPGTNVSVNRDYDTLEEEQVYDDAQSPDGFVERLGEPDIWGNEGEGDNLRMTATWLCRKGQYRKVIWRMKTRERGQQAWQVINEEVRDARPTDCDESAPQRNPDGGGS
jgi:hypothetical protein